MSRVLIVTTTTGYQIRAFERAAAERGIELVYATDRCRTLDDPWQDQAVPIRFDDETGSLAAIRRRLGVGALDGVIGLGDRATTMAAAAAEAYGVPWHSPASARVSRNKLLVRGALVAHGLPTPWFAEVGRDAGLADVAPRLRFPCVVKPLVLSGSRGVIRANDVDGFVQALARVRAILDEPDIRAMREPAAGSVLVEGFVSGPEYALEGVLDHGRLYVLAVFEKPDPLDGPYFEETIYVTPPRLSSETVQHVARGVSAACGAIGLTHGPVHAECRLNGGQVFVHEAAARPIGGLCAQALRFVSDHGATQSLEALLLAHATGTPLSRFYREDATSGVMMVPIPRAGYFRAVHGVREASRVRGVDDVIVTAKPGQLLRPLPEGTSYLGFVFARARTPDEVIAALRAAHAHLEFDVDRALAVARS
ncbi:MAG: ATP-grasp domain-containing protein [Vicinamibacterales bacterium]